MYLAIMMVFRNTFMIYDHENMFMAISLSKIEIIGKSVV